MTQKDEQFCQAQDENIAHDLEIFLKLKKWELGRVLYTSQSSEPIQLIRLKIHINLNVISIEIIRNAKKKNDTG